MASRDAIQALAAQIAEIEGHGAGRSQRPRSPQAGESDPEQTTPGAAAVRDPGSFATLDAPGDWGPDAALPTRDVNAPRGPSVVDVGGQRAHDEALGVAADGRPLDDGEDHASRGRRRAAKPAELAFSTPVPFARAIELAYKAVAQREHTAKQLATNLAKRGCEPNEIQGAIDELERHGFLDDRRYAKIFAEDKRRLQGWGARRIRLALTQAGVARETLDELFASDEAALDAPSELDAALELLRRKQPDLSDLKTKQRMAGMLARRGIASTTVFAALRQHAHNEATERQ